MKIYKQPAEKIPLTMDFGYVLPLYEDLQPSSEVKVYRIVDDEDLTSTMLIAVTIASPQINATIQGGVNNIDYKITFTGKTQNYIFEEDIILKVRAK